MSTVVLVKSIEYIVSLIGLLSGASPGGTTDFPTVAPLPSRPLLFIVVALSLPLGYTMARLFGSREAMGAGVEKYVRSHHRREVGKGPRHPVAKIASTALTLSLGPEAFMYIGMAAVYSSISTTPFGTGILVGEVSGDYILLFPGMLTSVIAREILGDHTPYRSRWRMRTRS